MQARLKIFSIKTLFINEKSGSPITRKCGVRRKKIPFFYPENENTKCVRESKPITITRSSESDEIGLGINEEDGNGAKCFLDWNERRKKNTAPLLPGKLVSSSSWLGFFICAE